MSRIPRWSLAILLTMVVKDLGENPLADASVDVNYASIGGPFTQTVTTDSNGIYFATVPFGHRSVQISSSGSSFGLVPGSVTVTGFNDVNFDVVNDSSSPVTVTHMTIDCAGTGATRSAAIDIGGQQVNGGDNIACLTQRSVSGAETTFAANPPPTPLRIVADSPDAQLPDLTLGAGGDTKTITLNDFEISGGGGNPNVDMSGGKTLKVTFFSSVSTEITTVTVVTP